MHHRELKPQTGGRVTVSPVMAGEPIVWLEVSDVHAPDDAPVVARVVLGPREILELAASLEVQVDGRTRGMLARMADRKLLPVPLTPPVLADDGARAVIEDDGEAD